MNFLTTKKILTVCLAAILTVGFQAIGAASQYSSVSDTPDSACRSSKDILSKSTGKLSEIELYAWRNDVDGIVSLTNAGNSLKNDDATRALTAAAIANSVEALNVLLEEEDIAKKENLTDALLSAAQCGNTAIIKSLLEHGADPNSRNKDGVDAVMTALALGHFEAAEYLIKFGYDSCGHRTSNGKTIRELAQSVGAKEIGKKLPSCK